MNRYFILVYFLAFTVFIFESVQALENEALVGGDLAPKGWFNYHATLIYEKHRCSGAILYPTHILTAAHCLTKGKNQLFWDGAMSVVVGTNEVNSTDSYKVEVDVVKFYIPMDYFFKSDSFFAADIALVKIKKPLDFRNPRIRAIAFAEGPEDYTDREAVVTATGVDEIEFSNFPEPYTIHKLEMSNKLRFASVHVLNPADCKQTYPLSDFSHLCGSMKQRYIDTSEGLCNGDAGAPLVVNGVVIGVQITGPKSCDEILLSSIYTRVSNYSTFIRKALQDDCNNMEVVCH